MLWRGSCLDHRRGPLGDPAPARTRRADRGSHAGRREPGEQRVGVRHLGGGRCEPEFDRRGWQPEEIGEGEELEELRAARTLRREPAVGREPAPLATVGPVEAETLRRARQPREERGLRAPSEVERHVVTARTQAREKRPDRTQTGAPLEHEDVVEPGMTCEQRRRRRLDEPGDARIGAAAPDAPEQRQRAHDVADGAREDDQQAHGSPLRAP